MHRKNASTDVKMYKIYYFKDEELINEEFINRILHLLPAERRNKALNYRQVIDKKNCVIAYIMLKTALRNCYGITEFTIKYGAYGKPYLAEYPGIFFNISHCSYGCVVALANERIGIDIQNIVPFSWKVANRVCCKDELKLLENSKDRAREFIRLWTMKESYLKMTGKGIYEDLKSVNTLEIDCIGVKEIKNVIISVCMK